VDFKSSKVNTSLNHTAIVDKLYNSSALVKENGQKYCLLKVHTGLVNGDKIRFECKYKKINNKGSFDLFIKSTRAIGIGYPKKLKVIQKHSDFRNNIHNNLLKYNNKYTSYALAMLYKTQTDSNITLFTNIKKMGVSFLFVISGFHISLIYNFTNKIKFKKSKTNKLKLIPIFLILCFLYLTYFPPTGIRAFLTIILLKLNKISKIDCLSMVAIIFFIINPWILLSNSMILSFGITYFIYFFSIPYKKNNFKNILILHFSCFFISIPTLVT